jgi:hypothetical protein
MAVMRRFDLALGLTAMTHIPPMTNHAVCGTATDHKHTDTFCSVLFVHTCRITNVVQRTNLTSVESAVLCNRTRRAWVCASGNADRTATVRIVVGRAEISTAKMCAKNRTGDRCSAMIPGSHDTQHSVQPVKQ